jgi:WD40 repeat protein
MGGGLSCPGLVVVGLILAALAVPLIDPPTEVASRIELPKGSLVSDLGFSPDGGRIYSDHKGLGATIVEVDEQGLSRGRSSGEAGCSRLVVDPKGRSVVVALSDDTLRVLDPETLEVRQALIGHDSRVMDLRFSEDGDTLVSIDSDGLVRVWTPELGRLDQEFRSPGRLASCALSPDGSRIALGGQDGSVSVFDAASGSELACWAGHGPGGVVMDMKFSPDGRTLVSLGLDHCLRLWSLEDRMAPIRTIPFPGGMAPCLAIAPDGRSFATGHLDGHVRLWDSASGELIGDHPVDSLNTLSVCFAPDGRRLAVANGSTVTLIDLIESA